MRLKKSGNLEMIQLIQKPGGSLKDSFLDEGFILDKKFNVGHPKKIENAKILIANTPMDTDKIKIYGARVRVDSMAKVGEIEAAEKQKMADKCAKIIAHGCNLFINRQLIYNYPEQELMRAGWRPSSTPISTASSDWRSSPAARFAPRSTTRRGTSSARVTSWRRS